MDYLRRHLRTDFTRPAAKPESPSTARLTTSAPRKPRAFRANYNKDSYRRAIDRAALRAFPIPKDIKGNPKKVEAWKLTYAWKPNQLRKSAATTARKQMDLETAQILLGHSSKKTTERYYAEMDHDRAIEFAQKYG